jgi:hypothetical protein
LLRRYRKAAAMYTASANTLSPQACAASDVLVSAAASVASGQKQRLRQVVDNDGDEEEESSCDDDDDQDQFDASSYSSKWGNSGDGAAVSRRSGGFFC